MAKTDVCVAFKAHQGWVAAVAVTATSKAPEPILATRLELVPKSDREAAEPYHVAGGWDGLTKGPQHPQPQKVIDRGRARQAKAATRVLTDFRTALAERDLAWQRAVMLVGRGRLGDLEHILAHHADIHVAEGEAIRASVRSALQALQIDCQDLDEKSVIGMASHRLAVSPDALEDQMKSARPPDAKSWTKELRLVALAGWVIDGAH